MVPFLSDPLQDTLLNFASQGYGAEFTAEHERRLNKSTTSQRLQNETRHAVPNYPTTDTSYKTSVLLQLAGRIV